MQQQQQQLSKLALRPAPGPLRIPHKHHSGKANFAQDAPHLLQKRQQYICKYVEEPSEPAGVSPPSGSSLPPQGLSGNTDEAFIFFCQLLQMSWKRNHTSVSRSLRGLTSPNVLAVYLWIWIWTVLMNINVDSWRIQLQLLTDKRFNKTKLWKHKTANVKAKKKHHQQFPLKYLTLFGEKKPHKLFHRSSSRMGAGLLTYRRSLPRQPELLLEQTAKLQVSRD